MAPGRDVNPDGQKAHVDAPRDAYDPGLHTLHDAGVSPRSLLYEPGGHKNGGTHAASSVEPGRDVKPSGHDVHVVELAAENDADQQGLHDAAVNPPSSECRKL